MPFDYRWHIKGRVLLVMGSGDLSLQAFQQLASTEFPDQIITEKLHVILFSDEIKSAPPMQQLAKLNVPENRGWIVFVSEDNNPIGRFIASVAVQLLNLDMRIKPTLEDAQALLKRADVSLAEYDFPASIDEFSLLGRIE